MSIGASGIWTPSTASGGLTELTPVADYDDLPPIANEGEVCKTTATGRYFRAKVTGGHVAWLRTEDYGVVTGYHGNAQGVSWFDLADSYAEVEARGWTLAPGGGATITKPAGQPLTFTLTESGWYASARFTPSGLAADEHITYIKVVLDQLSTDNTWATLVYLPGPTGNIWRATFCLAGYEGRSAFTRNDAGQSGSGLVLAGVAPAGVWLRFYASRVHTDATHPGATLELLNTPTAGVPAAFSATYDYYAAAYEFLYLYGQHQAYWGNVHKIAACHWFAT